MEVGFRNTDITEITNLSRTKRTVWVRYLGVDTEVANNLELMNVVRAVTKDSYVDSYIIRFNHLPDSEKTILQIIPIPDSA